MKFILLGFLVSSLMVALGRFTYLYFFKTSCMDITCMTNLNPTLGLMYIAAILIGTYNTYMYAKHQKNSVLIFEFIGTFIFAFGIHFFQADF